MKWSTYEISLWTHTDEYVSTLVQSGTYYSKEAQNPTLSMSATGEVNLNFTIPVVIYNKETKQWQDNTLWYDNLKNTNNLANEKKVKCIFDKGKKVNSKYAHRIIETVITSITEQRDGREVYCNVQCVGYAFKWLGKTGYQITLDSETVLLEEEEKEITIYPNINYWLDKVFPRSESGEWMTKWRYRIAMNYYGDQKRQPDKVYENDDIVTWTETEAGVEPVYSTEPIEKQRFIEVSSSNKYNITQDIAEIFEVFVRYDFLYEDESNPYKVTGGEVVFYNEFEDFTEYAITYQDNETGLSRTSDSNDIVTKMYVQDIESEYTDNGLISIADAPNNITKDNFTLNFDYFIQSGQMSSRQQSAIPQYERDIRDINNRLEENIRQRNALENRIIDMSIVVNTLADKLTAAQDNINDYNDKLAAINSGLTTNILSASKVAYLVSRSNDQKQITFKHAGVIKDTVKCITENIVIKTFILDDYGYAVGCYIDGIETGHLVNFSYDYDLLSYYRNQIQTYTSIRDSMAQQYEDQKAILGDPATRERGTLYYQLDGINAKYKQLADEKESINLAFEELMGYFLKEGEWNTSDYEAPAENKSIENCTIKYDTQAYDWEEKSYYIMGTDEKKVYYNYIIAPFAANMNIEQLVIVEKWSELGSDFLKQYLYNAQWTPQWLDIDGTPTFVLMFDSTVSVESGHTLTYIDTTGTEQNITSYYRSGEVAANHHDIAFRRYVIDDENVMIDSIKVIYAGFTLDEFYDYNLFNDNGKKVITFKCGENTPVSMSQFNIQYKCDRTTSQYYYDAVDVAATSAFPVVSYSVSFVYLQQVLNKTIELNIDPEYQAISEKLNNNIDLRIGSIVRINDSQLHFNGVKGIVYSISLDLEQKQNHSFTIQNYKTRFEDLFGRIVASSEQIKSRGLSYDRAADAILPQNRIVGSILQNTIDNNELAFNSGYTSGVSFDDFGITVENTYPYPNGVTGQLLLRGGAILLSDTVDADGNRIYHTGITPNGINASVITTGRLDAEKVNIYAGDQIRFTWNGEGLFAYNQYDDGTTYYDQFVRLNQDGLLYELDGVKCVELGWNGLYLGAQDGSVELTGDGGLVMYNGPSTDENRTPMFQLGRFGEAPYSYGLWLYDTEHNETLITDNNGKLWLKDTLTVGTGEGLVGITGVDSENPKAVRFWAGSATPLDAPFYVLQDGTFRATQAYIEGTIYATDGEFSGKIEAKEGSIGGWQINDNSISSGNTVLSSKPASDDDPNPQRFNINDKFIVTDDGTLTATGAHIEGTITATGGQIGNLTIGDVQNMAGDINSLTVEITSSNGTVTKIGEEFTTTFIALARRGNIPFTATEYERYTYQWEKADETMEWTILTTTIVPQYEYTWTSEKTIYIRCQMIEKEEP